MITVAIVGSNGLVNRLPEVLAHPDIHIHCFAEAGSPLLASAFVNETTVLKLPETSEDHVLVSALIEALAAQEVDMMIFADDLHASLIAQADIPLALKLSLLPVRLENGLRMIRSKAGFAQIMAEAGLRGPRSEVVTDAHAMARVLQAFSFPLVVKGDSGGGGLLVRFFADAAALDAQDFPDSWFPLVVQEFFEGENVSVEAVFRDGRLAGWQYSEVVEVVREFGPSTARAYLTPPSLDFERTLQDLGAVAGLHGFFNCSFFRSDRNGHHYLYEVDARPTAWHQFGPQLGLDWSAAILGDSGEMPLRPPIAPSSAVGVRLFPRELRAGLQGFRFRLLAPWLVRADGTWAMRNRADPAINRSESMELFFWFDVFVKRALASTGLSTRARRVIRFVFGFH
jgi:predicted ATP-grasp superfamily ATP-dependent carboligase